MLKIVPNPDAAYEICTVFAPNCRYQSRHRSNISSDGSRDYGSSFGMRLTSSDRYKSSSRIVPKQTSHTSTSSGDSFSIDGVSHRESDLRTNVSNYDRYGIPATFTTSNDTVGRHEEYESVIGESEYDYEEENEKDSDEDEYGDFYISPHGSTNVTYVLRPTMETSVRNQTTVHIKSIIGIFDNR